MTPETLAAIALRGIMGFALLVIGIRMVQRRSWSARAVRPWAIVAIVVCLITAFVEYRILRENRAILANNPARLLPVQQSIFAVGLVAQYVLGFVARLALPVFSADLVRAPADPGRSCGLGMERRGEARESIIV